MSSPSVTVRIVNLLGVPLTQGKHEFASDHRIYGAVADRIDAGYTGAEFTVEAPEVTGLVRYRVQSEDQSGTITCSLSCGQDKYPDRVQVECDPVGLVMGDAKLHTASDNTLVVTFQLGLPLTTTVRNDTKEEVYCIMTSRASDNDATFLAVAGTAIAAFGFVPFAIPAKALTINKTVSWTAAVLGGLSAAAGFYKPAGSEEARALFPSDILKHTSNNGILQSSHDIFLLKHELRGITLVCQYCVLKDYQNSELSISNATFRDVLKLDLPRGDSYKFALYRSASIHGLQPINQTTAESTKPQNYAIHAINRTSGGGTSVQYYDIGPTVNAHFQKEEASEFIITACHNDTATKTMYGLFYQSTGDVIVEFQNWKCNYDSHDSNTKPTFTDTKIWEREKLFQEILKHKTMDIFVFEEVTHGGGPRESSELRGWSRSMIDKKCLSYSPSETTPKYNCFFIIPSNRVTVQQVIEKQE